MYVEDKESPTGMKHEIILFWQSYKVQKGKPKSQYWIGLALLVEGDTIFW